MLYCLQQLWSQYYWQAISCPVHSSWSTNQHSWWWGGEGGSTGNCIELRSSCRGANLLLRNWIATMTMMTEIDRLYLADANAWILIMEIILMMTKASLSGWDRLSCQVKEETELPAWDSSWDRIEESASNLVFAAVVHKIMNRHKAFLDLNVHNTEFSHMLSSIYRVFFFNWYPP